MDDHLTHSSESIEINHQPCTSSMPLSAFVRQTVDVYFSQLNGHDAQGLHAMIICAVEKPLLEAALAHAGHNQTKAAKVLGLSRSTLRKKLDHYGLT
jgi:Fis family transcriptional regulator